MDESHGLKTHLREKNARIRVAINVIISVIKCFDEFSNVISGNKWREIF
jgi:hypothetical protein